MNRGIGQYQSIGAETSIVNASPHRLIQMLYEGALSQLTIAKGAIASGQVGLLSQSIKKTSNILMGLEEGLDFEKGQEIAQNYQALYQYIQMELVKVQASKSEKKLDELLYLLTEIKTGWDAIGENAQVAEKSVVSAV